MSNSKLILPEQVREQIFDYVDLVDVEIGMWGYVTMTDDADFLVDEVFLVEQEVTGTSVDFADAGFAYAIEKAAADDRLQDLLFCCHSHVNMGAYWSSTDEKMIEDMNNGMTPYLVSLVVNKKRESKQRVDFFNPQGTLGQFTKQITFPLDLQVQRDAILAEREAEVKALVKRPSYNRTNSYSWYRGKTLPATTAVHESKSTSKNEGKWDDDVNDRQMNWWDSDELWDHLDQNEGDWDHFEAGKRPVFNAAGDVTGWRDDDDAELITIADERGAL